MKKAKQKTFYATVLDLTDDMRRFTSSFGVKAASTGELLRIVRHAGYQRRATALAVFVTNDMRSTCDMIGYQLQRTVTGRDQFIPVRTDGRLPKQVMDAAVTGAMGGVR